MRITSGLVMGTAGVVALVLASVDASAAVTGPSRMDARAAVDLSGTWTGYRTNSATGERQALSIRWAQAPNGVVRGIVRAASERSYPVTVVWISGTKFILESAPHESPQMHERVVTRTVASLDGNQLRGRYEMRPTAYRGWTATGHLLLNREPPRYANKY